MSRRKRQPLLPPLAFGANRSTIDLTPQAMQDRVERMTNWVTRQDSANPHEPFAYQAVATKLEDMTLIASSSTSTVMQVDARDLTLVIPLRGQFKTRIEQHHYEYAAGDAAMLNPKAFRDSEGGLKSSLIISFEEHRLQKTIAAIKGSADPATQSLANPLLLPLKAGNVEFDRVFLSLCQLIDKFEGQAAALAALGLDDSFYRAIALLLNQKQFLTSDEERSYGNLDKLCDYIVGHIAERITLTDLESMSGLSARALQYAFLKQFNCTPMQWVRQRKAEYARSLLLQGGESTTVASVAVQCGFANFSKFSLFYQTIFQEKPSETIKRALSKK